MANVGDQMRLLDALCAVARSAAVCVDIVRIEQDKWEKLRCEWEHTTYGKYVNERMVWCGPVGSREKIYTNCRRPLLEAAQDASDTFAYRSWLRTRSSADLTLMFLNGRCTSHEHLQIQHELHRRNGDIDDTERMDMSEPLFDDFVSGIMRTARAV